MKKLVKRRAKATRRPAESSDEEEAVKAGQVNLCSVLVPLISLFTGESCLVPKWD